MQNRDSVVKNGHSRNFFRGLCWRLINNTLMIIPAQRAGISLGSGLAFSMQSRNPVKSGWSCGLLTHKPVSGQGVTPAKCQPEEA